MKKHDWALQTYKSKASSDIHGAILDMLKILFKDSTVVGPIQVPYPQDDYFIYEYKVKGILSIRYSTWTSGHILSIKYVNGWYWILSRSTEDRIPSLSDWDMSDLTDWAEKLPEHSSEVEENIFKCFSDSSDNTYDVDTKAVTCGCRNFKYRCSHHTIDREERLCKHLVQVYDNYPELKPKAMTQLTEGMDTDGLDSDGKKRYVRALFDMYVKDIRSVLDCFNSIINTYEFCGSYRRRAERVSDLDVLIQLKDGASWDSLLDYLEGTMGYVLIPEIGKGECKAAYMIDGFVHVDFKNVTKESWPFALMHFTGSKSENINMRRKANSMGFTLNEYGLLNRSTNEYVQGLKTERDVYKYLEVPYKEPYER